MKSHPLNKILWLMCLVAVSWARTEDDQDRPTLRGTNTSNAGSSPNGPFPGFGASNPGFRQQGDQQSFGNGLFGQGGLRQQQLLQQFQPQQQFDGNIGPFQSGLQQNLLRPDLALLQQQNSNNLRQNSNLASSQFANPLLNQGAAQFSPFGNQDFNRNPSSFQQQQSFGLSPFQGQGLQSALGSSIQGQFPGQFEQQNPLLLALLQQQQQQNSFDAQSQFGGRPQLNAGSAFESQRQLALQQQLLAQLGLIQQNPFQQSFNSFSNDAQFSRPSRPNNHNTGSLGSSSLNSANQVILQGGQFQDPSFSSRPFINSNRFPFQQSGLLGNGLLFDGNNNFGSQFAGSQFDWTALNRNQASKQRPNLSSFQDEGQQRFGFGGIHDQFGRIDPFFHGSPSSFSKSSSWNEINRDSEQTFRSQAELERYKLMQQFNRQPSSRFPDSSVLGTRFGSPIPQNPFVDPVRTQKPNAEADNEKKTNEIPETGFSCEGRAPGHYADVSTGCRVFHVCHLDGSKSSFACGNGTLFDQAHTVCQWADDVDCAKSPLFYPQTHRPSAAVPTTQEPVRTQIPTPVNPASTTTLSPQRPNSSAGVSSHAPALVFGQPNIAMGSLDAGRSIKDVDRNSRPFSLFAPPNVRPPLHRRNYD